MASANPPNPDPMTHARFIVPLPLLL